MLVGQETKKTIRIDDRESFKRGKEVSSHLAKGWCPINPATKGKITELSLSGSFNPYSATSIILKDSGFCTLVLRNLRSIFPDQDKMNPIEAMLSLEQEKLLELASLPEHSISRHSLKKASTKQVLEIQSNVYALSAAETFSNALNTDSLESLWTTYCNELGNLLTAWNYPEQYALAVVRQKKNQSLLSAELERLIGISSVDIANNLFKEWRIDASVPKSGETNLEALFEDLNSANIAKLASAWSRAQNPKDFPAISKEFSKQEHKLTEIFGEDIASELLQSCHENFASYSKHFPARVEFKPASAKPEHMSNIPSVVLETLTSADLQLFMKINYESTVGSPQQALRLFVDQLVPRLGFTRGCLFLQSSKEQLIPILRFGDLSLSRYNEFFIDQEKGLKTFVFSPIPSKFDTVGACGYYTNFICAGIDDPKVTGVLYLEMSEELLERDGNFGILCFKMARKLLVSIVNALR